MKRKMDLIRDILIAIENNDELSGEGFSRGYAQDFYESEEYSPKEIGYQMQLMIERGYLDGSFNPPSGQFDIYRLTMDGHDFLDTIRNPLIWEKTKEGAQKAGGFTLKLLADLATGLVKTKIEQHTGIKL